MMISLEESPDILKFLEKLIVNCYQQKSDMLFEKKVDGSSRYTPLTLFYVLLGLRDKVSGGISTLLSFIKKVSED